MGAVFGIFHLCVDTFTYTKSETLKICTSPPPSRCSTEFLLSCRPPFSTIICSHAMSGVTESSLWVSPDGQMQVISTLALYAAYISFLSFFWQNSSQWVMVSSFTRFLHHTQRRTTVGRTPLDEWSARRRDLYLTTHNRQTPMPPVVFEPTISAGEQPHTYALDRAATGTGQRVE
jgi:hypothetical protein